jgi:hypothetical protein
MKTIVTVISILMTLTSIKSFAGYSDEQLRSMAKCTVEECKVGDGGYGYKVACENTVFNGRVYDSGTEVLLKRPSAGKLCYCPCTLEYWSAMRGE